MKADYDSSESASFASDVQQNVRQMRNKKNVMIVEDSDEGMDDSEFN